MCGLRFEDLYQFVRGHARERWAEFGPIMHERVDPVESGFGSPGDANPERPMQVGYGVGMQICEAFYQTAADESHALQQTCTAYLPERFETILAPYSERMRIR